MNITSDIQKLEPGNKVQLIEVDGSEFDAPILRFHAYNLLHTSEDIDTAGGGIKPKSIWWQGHEYGAWAYEIEGMAKNSDGSPARPD
ncbi:phage minor tail protein L [Providencia alcalifaciens]|nr:phage minor tail protein L [Providencia alcalifaciens]